MPVRLRPRAHYKYPLWGIFIMCRKLELVRTAFGGAEVPREARKGCAVARIICTEVSTLIELYMRMLIHDRLHGTLLLEHAK